MKRPSFLRKTRQSLGGLMLALAFSAAVAAPADEAAPVSAPAVAASAAAETPTRPAAADFQTALQGLAANDFHTKQAAVEALAASGHAHTLDILAALADGRLFAAGNAFYIQNVQTDTFSPIDAPDAAAEKPEGARKITVNNKIRQWVRHYVAENALSSSHPAERKAAMEQMLQKKRCFRACSSSDGLAEGNR